MRRILRRGAEGALDHRGHLIVVDRPRSARPGLIQQGIDNGRAQLLTRTGFHWTAKYPSAIAALASVNVKTAYIDGELCGVDEEGLPSFASTQAATDGERDVRLVYYAFDLLHLDGRDVSGLPLIERKALLEPLVAGKLGLQFNGHEAGDGELILRHSGKLGFEGVVSKTIDAPYAPGNPRPLAQCQMASMTIGARLVALAFGASRP